MKFDRDTITAELGAKQCKKCGHIGAGCPHSESKNVHRMAGRTQAGISLCNDCREKFTARVGNVMERSHIPVHKWLLAMHLMAASKKGMSSKQLQRKLV